MNPLIYGTMGLGQKGNTKEELLKASEAISTALALGIRTFDFANIYQLGNSEKIFGAYLKQNPSVRNKIKIQSKVGIQLNTVDPWKTQYNFSYKHVVEEVYQILDRLGIKFLDSLLLHRYDPIFDPKELAQAIRELKKEGLVKSFGVSNMNYHQINLLNSLTDEPITINQLEMNLNKLDWIESSILFNHRGSNILDFSPGTLEYCFLNEIELQAWGALAQGTFSGRKISGTGSERLFKTKEIVRRLSDEMSVPKEAIVLAFLLKHPFNIRPVIGSTTPQRIKNMAECLNVSISREQWYELLSTARGKLLP